MKFRISIRSSVRRLSAYTGRVLPATGRLIIVGVVGLVALAGYVSIQSPEAASAASDPAATLPPAAPAKVTAALLEHRFDSQIKPLLQQHCYRCHANGKHKGDIALDHYPTLLSIQKDRKTWRHVYEILSQKTMPPKERPRPSPQEYATLIDWINDEMNFYDCSGPRDPGRVAINRLNRTEYNNTLRDLLGIDFKPAADFPNDDTGYGFDNIADVLSMSPLQAEKYLAAAEQALDKALVTDNPNASKKVRLAKLQATGQGNSGGDLMVNGEAFASYDFVSDGSYEIHISAAQDRYGKEPAKMVLKLDDKDLKTYEVVNRRGKTKTFSYKLQVQGGKHKLAAAYINNAKDPNNPDPKKRGDRNLHVEYIEVEGPFDAPPPPPSETYKRIFFVKPGEGLAENQAAWQIIGRFASRAFRRPAKDAEMNALLNLYQSARGDGESFESSIKIALSAVLVSPHFLYRIELDPPNAPPGTIHAISDYELATRLSYFLWSSTPDDTLIALAGANQLHEPAVLDAQVKRMLADPKSRALVDNFFGQWLELRSLDDTTRNGKIFPEFNDRLLADMRRETQLFVENIVHNDGSVLDLLSGDYTFVNARLAKLYGIKGVEGDNFRRVSLDGLHRGGVLTQASVLTVTAMPSRTSPVRRGKFILEQILGQPSPPPPPDLPVLDDTSQARENASLRQRFEAHRANPSCAVCHVKLDPLGFSLENFNAIGQWRDKDGKFPIDATGKLPDGTALTGPDSLRQVLIAHREDFILCLVDKMLTYALGRGTEFYDQCTIHDIAGLVQKNDYRFSSLVMGIVKSDAFLKRRTPTLEELQAVTKLAGAGVTSPGQAE